MSLDILFKIYEDYPFVVTLAISISVAVLIVVVFSKNNPQKEVSDRSKGQLNEEKNSIVEKEGSVLNPATFRNFNILQIFDVSYNTKIFRLEIPFGKPLGLPIGRHISVRAEVNGNKVIRAYTPTSKPDQKGYFDLMVKAYEFGKLSSHLHSLKVGDSIEVRGPIGRFKYEKNQHQTIGLIAGGTGLTPCLQLLRCILDGPEDDVTKFILFFQNRTEKDILLKQELDLIASKYPTRFQVFYYLGNPQTTNFGDKTNEKKGYISQEMVTQYMNNNKCSLVCICGPSGFNDAMKKLLEQSGHTDTSIYIW